MDKVENREIIIKEEEEIDLYELISSILKYKKLILFFTLIPTLIAAIISLVMKDIYRAEAVIVSVSPSNKLPFSQLSEMLPIGIDINEDNRKIMAVLKSRHIRERITDKLNLPSLLLKEDIPQDKDPKEITIGILKNITNITEDRKLGTIKIAVDHEDPQVARMIADAYIKEVQSIIDEKALTKAKMERISIEKKLGEVESRIKRLQNKLVQFQKETRLVAPKEQLTSSMELYSNLLSQKTALEMELKSLLTFGGDPDRITEIRNKIREIKRKIREIESKNFGSVLPSFKEIPEEMSEYYSILRELKLSQAIYETLLKLYENVRFAEMKEAIYVEVIDPPYVLSEPVKPKRMLIITVSLISSFFLSVFIVLLLEGIRRRREKNLYPAINDGNRK